MFSSYGFYGLHANNCGTYLYHFWQHKKILKANDLPTDLNVHSLRYTAASSLPSRILRQTSAAAATSGSAM